MKVGNTDFNEAYAAQVSKAQWVKEHAHLKEHGFEDDLGETYDKLTKKSEPEAEEGAAKPAKIKK